MGEYFLAINGWNKNTGLMAFGLTLGGFFGATVLGASLAFPLWILLGDRCSNWWHRLFLCLPRNNYQAAKRRKGGRCGALFVAGS